MCGNVVILYDIFLVIYMILHIETTFSFVLF